MKYWSRHSFGSVSESYLGKDTKTICNEAGHKWNIDEDIFNEEFIVADEYTETKKVSRTKIIEAILQAPYMAMAVCFKKKPDNTKLAKSIYSDVRLNCGNVNSIQDILDNAGETRVMVGRHHCGMNEHGRLKFYDVEAQCWKQIDTRTIEWAIVKGTKWQSSKLK